MSSCFSVHIDVDSPLVLADFYNKDASHYTLEQLEKFYEQTFERACTLFEQYGVQGTFFCVASEISRSPKIKEAVQKALDRGHHLGHHTLTHPFGLNEMNPVQRAAEIESANKIFQESFGFIPQGFRTPGYAVDTEVINLLKKNGIKYDSSAAWPIFHVIFKWMRSRKKEQSGMKVGYGETNSGFISNPYSPADKNWKEKSGSMDFMEYPLPSSFFILPCYGNLHLYFPPFFTKLLLIFTRRHKHLIYLMHSIEFASIEDEFIPEEILVHPHVSKPNVWKQRKIEAVLKFLSRNREHKVIEE